MTVLRQSPFPMLIVFKLDTGFPGNCPYELQVVIINKMNLFFANETILKTLYSSKDNWLIVLEIYRQVKERDIEKIYGFSFFYSVF